MRIIYLANNLLGLNVAKWLKNKNESIVGLILHPQENQKYGSEIHNAVGISSEKIFYGNTLDDSDVLKKIKALDPDFAISVMFGYILKEPFLKIFNGNVLNLHPSYLPYNRGAYPNVWPIIDNTPAGVSLHYVDVGIDTGDIINQKNIPIEPIDTGETLYKKLEVEALNLFKETFDNIKSGKHPRLSQEPYSGTSHKKKDIEKIDCIDLDKKYTARELINILRARTFPPYCGAYFVENGKKVYLELSLKYEKVGK